jgi:hypothetical protein
MGFAFEKCGRVATSKPSLPGKRSNPSPDLDSDAGMDCRVATVEIATAISPELLAMTERFGLKRAGNTGGQA